MDRNRVDLAYLSLWIHQLQIREEIRVLTSNLDVERGRIKELDSIMESEVRKYEIYKFLYKYLVKIKQCKMYFLCLVSLLLLLLLSLSFLIFYMVWDLVFHCIIIIIIAIWDFWICQDLKIFRPFCVL